MSRIKCFIALVEVMLLSTLDCALINTRLGEIEGLNTTLKTGKTVDAFLGIPYALSPTGDRRFASPEPATPWKGTLQAKKKSPICIQTVSEEEKRTLWFVSNLTEGEDCLYLNVWRPSGEEQKNLAVMLWIHGGAFIAGSGNMPLYDGSILATEQNVVVVTFNYRLSIFGQLFLDIPEAPANVNLQDQILAMKWIQEYIASFGGDPNQVTLFGESAGAISIEYHLTNPALRTMFKNAILESGSANIALGIHTPEQAVQDSLKAAKNLGCPSSLNEDRTSVLNCLRQLDTSEITNFYNQFPLYFNVSFQQVTNGVEVCKDVQTCVGEGPRKPILIGTNKNEFNWLMKYLFPGTQIDDNTVLTEKDWKTLLGVFFMLKDERLVKLAMEPYVGVNEPYNPKQVRLEVGSFVSDSFIICPSIGFAEQYTSNFSHTYMYSFTQRLSKPRTPMPLWVGTVHGDEIPYVFGAPLDPNNGFPKDEVPFSKKVMGYWTSFAKTGDPNGAQSSMDKSDVNGSWPTFDTTNRSYFSLGMKSTTGRNLEQRGCSFWKNTFPLLSSLQLDLDKAKNP